MNVQNCMAIGALSALIFVWIAAYFLHVVNVPGWAGLPIGFTFATGVIVSFAWPFMLLWEGRNA